MEEFEPKILGFCCSWGAYFGIDEAGIHEIQYPSNICIIRIMCSGAVDIIYILEAFRKGADGVLIVGCKPGACHYQDGNLYLRSRVGILKPFLKAIGIEGERLGVLWLSPPEGERFADEVTGFTNKIRTLGPNPFRRQYDES